VISSGNVILLKTVKGIGQKTAERVIVELKDKIRADAASVDSATAVSGGNSAVLEEAVAALTTLGFAAAPSQMAVVTILKQDPQASVESVIRQAFKRL
jgi:Holliday junction DNA helicase RuvA